MLKKSFMLGRVERHAVSACYKICVWCVQVQKMRSKMLVCIVETSGGTIIKMGAKRGQKNILGEKGEKMHVKRAKICYLCQFYTKTVKFGLILTHLSLFFWGGAGKKIVPLYGTATGRDALWFHVHSRSGMKFRLLQSWKRSDSKQYLVAMYAGT